MIRVKWIDNEGRRILYLDLSYIKDIDEISNILKQTESNINNKPIKSVPIIVNAHKLKLDSEVGQIIMIFLMDNEKYIKALAILGLSGIKRRILSKYIKSYGRDDIGIFRDIEEAKNWVIS